jgi:hypothetical protein
VTQPVFELASGFSVFTAALCDAAAVLGMLIVPPAGQNVQRETSVSKLGILYVGYSDGDRVVWFTE